VELRQDFLIIGSGIAGLRAAAELAPVGRVLILTKAEPREGNTGYAQGGIAAAVGPGDSSAVHAADTIAAGAGLCDENAVTVLVEDGPRYVHELIEWGAAFDRDADGNLELALEAAHTVRRVLHAADATGREISRTLWTRVAGLSSVTAHDHARAVDLIVEDGRCVGARFLQEDGSLASARADVVLLATGGAGQVYSDTTNPLVATGDGVAMAYLAGARVADLEFFQFHPTALDVPGQPRFLLSEALRGEGARLLNSYGEPFVTRYDPAGDLAPRDRVARAIVRESARTGGKVTLSLEHLDPDYVHARFPRIAAACRLAGLDLARDRIPVGPAAHYMMGGVQTDLDGRTTVPGLFAAGEVACTGVHGANRLASNSLLEGLVFGARAGRAMADSRVPAGEGGPGAATRGALESWNLPSDAEIQALMWRHVGLFRDREGLQTALGQLEPAGQSLETVLEEGQALDAARWRTASLLTTARLIARAALRREESRGGHYRSDFPKRDDINWKHRESEKKQPSAEGRSS
jgi:L-aspartate oxidase